MDKQQPVSYYLNNSYQLLQPALDCGDCMICPPKLYLDITEDCNLWCKMCRENRSVYGRSMPMELFRRIVDETSPYVRSYSLFNWGEPLIDKAFRERVQYVNSKKRPDCNVEISTNGMLLNEDMLSFLVAEGVNIIISADAADKESFESIRRGSDFDLIMRHAKNAVRVYSAFPAEQSPSFYVSVQRDNQFQLLSIIKLAHSLGIRRFGCGLVVSPEGCAAIQNRDLCDKLERVYSYAECNSLLMEIYPTKIGDYVFTDGRYRQASSYILSTICNAPFICATVDYTGNVYLCCNVGDCVSNIRESGFLKLWHSDRYNELRRNVNDMRNMPSRCLNCPWFNRN